MKEVLNFIKNIIITIIVIVLPFFLMILFVPKDVLCAIDNRIDSVALAVSLYSLEMSIAIAFLMGTEYAICDGYESSDTYLKQ